MMIRRDADKEISEPFADEVSGHPCFWTTPLTIKVSYMCVF